ncbi:MAG: division/cell wall cluster transcriptional repressor MraZ [Tepidiformaceae bacterium]
MFFVGKYDYQMDDRNRVPIPPNYRAAFKEGGYVAQGTGNFLVLHTEESLTAAATVVANFPRESDYGENVRRDLFANTWQVTPDGQGRILLDRELIEHAGLRKEVKVVGTGERMEIWDRAAWDAGEADRKGARRQAMNAQEGA